MLLSEIVRAVASFFHRMAAHAAPQVPATAAAPVAAAALAASAPPAAPVAQTQPAAARPLVPVVPVNAPCVMQPVVPPWLVLCLPLTKHFESCQLVAYCDPASPRGNAITKDGQWSAYLADRAVGERPAYRALDGTPWTCGFGSTGVDVNHDTTWDQAQADARLMSQLQQAGAAVDRYVTVEITPAQKAALSDFVFNEGEGHFATSTLLHRLNASDFAGAASEFARWNLAGGEVLNGLVTRRATEKQLFTAGVWNP